MALNFREFILSFNSADHLASNAVTASSVQDSYTVWLTQIVTWIRQHPKGDCPIFETIRENTTVWSGFGSYLTNILLAHAGLRPWTSTLDVIKSPSQLARLCEAAFELYWCGHRDNVARLHRALQYNQHTLCASKKEVLEYVSVFKHFYSSLIELLC
ncbi:hypothetical protein EV360DRAFT_56052 [Lentinula raphanica]|nr:hypothetical protein EV360DRAFT_56052 [Lentinula raphanica]